MYHLPKVSVDTIETFIRDLRVRGKEYVYEIRKQQICLNPNLDEFLNAIKDGRPLDVAHTALRLVELQLEANEMAVS